MKNEPRQPPLDAIILESQTEFTLAEFCRVCAVQLEYVVELVDEGVLAPMPPIGAEPYCWRFSGAHQHRVSVAWRLQRDLGVNLAGAALALELLDEVKALRSQLAAICKH